jgi:thioredoxin reductase (NADPH)
VGGGGNARLEQLVLRTRADGSDETVAADALFLMIGAHPHTDWLPPSIERDEQGFILTGPDLPAGVWTLDRDPFLLETSVPGIFACGDVRYGPVKRVAAAVGEGSMAIAFVHQYFKDADSVLAGDLVQVGTPAPEGRRDQRDDDRGPKGE